MYFHEIDLFCVFSNITACEAIFIPAARTLQLLLKPWREMLEGMAIPSIGHVLANTKSHTVMILQSEKA